MNQVHLLDCQRTASWYISHHWILIVRKIIQHDQLQKSMLPWLAPDSSSSSLDAIKSASFLFSYKFFLFLARKSPFFLVPKYRYVNSIPIAFFEHPLRILNGSINIFSALSHPSSKALKMHADFLSEIFAENKIIRKKNYKIHTLLRRSSTNPTGVTFRAWPIMRSEWHLQRRQESPTKT